MRAAANRFRIRVELRRGARGSRRASPSAAAGLEQQEGYYQAAKRLLRLERPERRVDRAHPLAGTSLMSAIETIHARQILDSLAAIRRSRSRRAGKRRPRPCRRPLLPSTGFHEAVELRDGDAAYGGKGVLRRGGERPTARAALDGTTWRDQRSDLSPPDRAGRHDDKGRFGANAILAMSLAVAKARQRTCGRRSTATAAGQRRTCCPCPR